MNDICLNCGKEHKDKIFGAKCNCNNPNVVHQIKCSGCNKIMGYINDDDYISIEIIYCPDCIVTAKKILK